MTCGRLKLQHACQRMQYSQTPPKMHFISAIPQTAFPKILPEIAVVHLISYLSFRVVFSACGFRRSRPLIPDDSGRLSQLISATHSSPCRPVLEQNAASDPAGLCANNHCRNLWQKVKCKEGHAGNITDMAHKSFQAQAL